jgi:Zn-dependent protease
MVWVAIAGPATNMLMLLAAALLINVLSFVPEFAVEWIGQNLVNMILINAILAVFNMLPIPPLDGGRVAVGLLPDILARPLARLEKYGMLIIIMMLFVVPMAGSYIGMDFSVFQYIILPPVEVILEFANKIAIAA